MPDFLTDLAPSLGQALVAAVGLLRDEKIASALAGGLLLAGLAAVGLLVARTVWRVRQVGQAATAVAMAVDDREFARHFDGVSTRIEALPVLRDPWLRFKSTLVFSQDANAPHPTIKCTASPEDFFTPSAISMNWRDYRALPGLFLTVIGIAGSLSQALRAVDDGQAGATRSGLIERTTPGSPGTAAASPNANTTASEGVMVERMRIALRHLLDSSGTTFSIAIAGLLISLLLTATIRICAGSLKSALQGFVDTLLCRVALVSFEAIVLERLPAAGAAGAVKDATGHQLAQALDKALPPHIDAAMVKILASLERNNAAMAGSRTGSADPSAQQLHDELSKLIDDRVAEPIRGMTEQLSEQMLSVRGHMIGLVNVVTDGQQDPHKIATAQAAGSHAAAADLSVVVQAIERGHDFNALALRDLSSRLESTVANPMRDLSSTLSDIRAKLIAPATQMSFRQPGSQLQSAPDMSPIVQAIERGQDKFIDANTLVMNGLSADLAARLESNLVHPLRALSTALGDMRAKLASLERGMSQPGPATAAAPFAADASIHIALSQLLTSVEHSNERIGLANRAAIQQLAAELINRLDSGIAHPMRGMSDTMGEIRARLAAVAETVAETAALSATQSVAQTSIAPVPGNELAQHEFRLQTEISALRRALEESNGRIVGDNRTAIRDHTQAVVDHLDRSMSLSMQGMADVLGEMRSRLTRVEAALSHAAQPSVATAGLAEQATQLQSALTTLLGAVTQGSDKVVEHNDAMINALAEDFADRLRRDVANPIMALTETLARVEQDLGVRTEAASSDSAVADLVKDAANDVRQVAAEMSGALTAMTSQARDDCEVARRTLLDQIGQSIHGLEAATRHFESNGADISARLKTALDAAPATLTREAEIAARAMQAAADKARQQLEQTVTALAEATARETRQSAEALAAISEQLVRQSTHARDALNTQLAVTVNSIERAASNIDQTFERLSQTLAQGTRAAATDALGQMAGATVEINTATRRSSEETVQSVETIWQAAKAARAMITADLEQIREQVASQAELVNADFAQRLRETAAEVAILMSGYGGDLSSTANTLVQTLHAVSGEMRRLETAIAQQEMAQPMQQVVNGGAVAAGPVSDPWRTAPRAQTETGGRGPSTAAAAAAPDDDSAEAVLGRFIESRRAFISNFDKG